MKFLIDFDTEKQFSDVLKNLIIYFPGRTSSSLLSTLSKQTMWWKLRCKYVITYDFYLKIWIQVLIRYMIFDF